ncbi:MAG: hypothetical protein LBJ94_04040 [Puniceicoccales bacterium]|jgi:hypothetical protein|nr:hypothetical protein [Puniceicoccales bacterium]
MTNRRKKIPAEEVGAEIEVEQLFAEVQTQVSKNERRDRDETPAEKKARKAEAERIFAEVQAQISENERKNREYFAHMEHHLRENELALKKIAELDKKNDAIWAPCEIKPGKNGEENPFLILEKLVPDAFRGMGEWAKKARREIVKKITAHGLHYKKIGEGSPQQDAIKQEPGSGKLNTVLASATGKNPIDSTDKRGKKRRQSRQKFRA